MMCNLLFVTFFNIPFYDMKLPCPLEKPFSFAKFCQIFVLFKGELPPKTWPSLHFFLYSFLGNLFLKLFLHVSLISVTHLQSCT